jgi:hypothetical protein
MFMQCSGEKREQAADVALVFIGNKVWQSFLYYMNQFFRDLYCEKNINMWLHFSATFS